MPLPAPVTVADIETAEQRSLSREPSLAEETLAIVTEQRPESTTADASETSEPVTAAPGTSSSEARSGTPGGDQSSRSESNPADGASAETDSSTGPLVALLVALLAIGFFVLRALK